MLYHRWIHKVDTDSTAVIIPDGCCDLIIVSDPDQEDELRLSSWDFQPRQVQLKAGSEIVGYRLRPGVTIDSSLGKMQATCGAELNDLIEEVTSRKDEIGQIIQILSAHHSTIESVAKQAGVTIRTLQRHFQNRNLPSPDYWRLLGRARRAVQALPCRVSLAEIAYEYGYCDQAHMTREMVRWFGLAPAQLRQDKALLDEICQPGLGNWSSNSH